jgi:hypothetical protein
MHVVNGGPAGGGFSTVEDLVKFAAALQSHKLLDAKHTELVLTGKVSAFGLYPLRGRVRHPDALGDRLNCIKLGPCK